MLQSLVGLARHGFGGEQFLELDRVRAELQHRPDAGGGAIDAADREEFVGDWLERRGVEFAWQMAPLLAAKGADRAWLDELEAIAGEDGLAPAIRWVTSTIGMAGLLSELTDATNRISHLVQDVKTYSQMDRASLQYLDLSSGLESTLTMLAPKLAGIEVVREYHDDVPEVEVYAAELNQVWTNLIDNALDAMDGEGTLRLGVALEGDDVVVEVGDSGAGHRAGDPAPRVRAVLHDQGRRTGHRPRPGHLPADRRRPPRRLDRVRVRSRLDDRDRTDTAPPLTRCCRAPGGARVSAGPARAR